MIDIKAGLRQHSARACVCCSSVDTNLPQLVRNDLDPKLAYTPNKPESTSQAEAYIDGCGVMA